MGNPEVKLFTCIGICQMVGLVRTFPRFVPQRKWEQNQLKTVAYIPILTLLCNKTKTFTHRETGFNSLLPLIKVYAVVPFESRDQLHELHTHER